MLKGEVFACEGKGCILALSTNALVYFSIIPVNQIENGGLFILGFMRARKGDRDEEIVNYICISGYYLPARIKRGLEARRDL